MPHSGSCLCGATKIEIKGESQKSQIACHCTDCRQTSGAPFSSNILVPVTDVSFEGPTSEYESPAASGNTVTRVFCSKCGSALAHKSKGLEPKMAVQTGNLSDFVSAPFEAELFIKDRFTGLAPIDGASQNKTMPGA